jgi:hypothetical protein
MMFYVLRPSLFSGGDTSLESMIAFGTGPLSWSFPDTIMDMVMEIDVIAVDGIQ